MIDSISLRPPQSTDLVQIQPILSYWIRDDETGSPLPNEVCVVLDNIRANIDGYKQREYLTAENSKGKVLGVMGITLPADEMMQHAKTDHPVELINAAVAPGDRGKGIGRLLVAGLENLAIEDFEATEVLVSSSPRYKDTGWGFWTRLYGKPIATELGLYGRGGEKVWRKTLVKPTE